MASNYIRIKVLNTDGHSGLVELQFDYSFNDLKLALVKIGYEEIDKYTIIIDGRRCNLTDENNFPFLKRSITDGRTIHIMKTMTSSEFKSIDDDGNNYLSSSEKYDEDLEIFMKKQNQLKAYYDNFPGINEALFLSEQNFAEAKKFTDEMLRRLPSGNVSNRDTLCHVLNKILTTKNTKCLFYNSEIGINLTDTMVNLTDIVTEDRPFVLKFKNGDDLAKYCGISETDDYKLARILTDLIEKNTSDPIIDGLVDRLANAHNTHKSNIIIKAVYVGSLNLVYNVNGPGNMDIDALPTLEPTLQREFGPSVSVHIHPLLGYATFNIANFDERGDKNFPFLSQNFQVGPVGRTKEYIQPNGWTRFGLKVLHRYSGKWLEPFGDPENWYRAFHGTGNAQPVDFQNNTQIADQHLLPVQALSSIYENGFRPARVAAYGAGVYCSPNPKFPENNGYVQAVTIDTECGRKTFKCMLQVAVNPDGVQIRTDSIWVVPQPENIRAYGILIKENLNQGGGLLQLLRRLLN